MTFHFFHCRWLLPLALVATCTPPLSAQLRPPQTDSDHDGLSDLYEQALLEKFRPTLMVSASDCAASPARFDPGLATPSVVAKDGTLYGQVFPLSPDRIEVHYYTLWDRDCGRVSHPLDVEHLAGLLLIHKSKLEAIYWYAGAHENTLCDISSGALAESVQAIERGPQIWSSSGKHALYFRQTICNSGSGCGADTCADAVPLASSSPVINLGELSAPANGSAWVNSPLWTLREKMDSDFAPPVIALLNASQPGDVVTVRGRSTFRGTIQVSDTVLESATTGAQHTSGALSTADQHTSKSLGRAANATGRSLRRAWNSVFRDKADQPKK